MRDKARYAVCFNGESGKGGFDSQIFSTLKDTKACASEGMYLVRMQIDISKKLGRYPHKSYWLEFSCDVQAWGKPERRL